MLCTTYDSSNNKPELFNEKVIFFLLRTIRGLAQLFVGRSISLMDVKLEERSEIQQGPSP